MDCGRPDGHDDACPQRADLLRVLDVELARLRDGGGRAYTRPLDRADIAVLENAGRPVPPRRDRRRWSVRVEPLPGGVRRTLCDPNGAFVAEITDEPIGGVA